jgi:glycosyltransferase involved in cell wall biosynthesis
MKNVEHYNNLHITLTDFTTESRLLKEALSLLKYKVVKTVYVAGLHAQSLMVDQNFGEQLIVRRFKLLSRSMSKNLIGQFIKYFEFCFLIYFYYRNKKIKIVNIHSLGLLPLGVALKFLFNAKLIYDTHELETEKNGDHGIRKKLSKWIERLLINQVDMTIVVSESIAEWYEKNYSINRPPVILNAPNRRELIKTDHFRTDLGIRKDQIIVLYQGGLTFGRGIDLILDAFNVRNDDNVVVVFMGYGSLTEKIKFFSTQNNNIFYYPAVSPDVVLEYTVSADFGLSLIENTCLSYFYCMPNKLFEYAMAGLPVLTSDMKDMAVLVKENKMGLVIKEFTNTGLNAAIDDLLRADIDEMKANAYWVACNNSWEIQEKKLLKAYKDHGINAADILMGEI